MKKSILVVGVGRFGEGVIRGLTEMGHEVFAIDKSEFALNGVRDLIVSGAIIDVTEYDDELSQIAGKKNFDAAVVAMGSDFEATLLASHIIQESGVPMYVQVGDERRGNILKKLGVKEIIYPERDSGRRLAHFINNRNVIDVLNLPQGYLVEQMTVAEGLAQKTILDLDVIKRLGLWILLIYRDGDPFVPVATSQLQKGDVMIVFGKKENVFQLEQENSRY